MVKKTGCQGQKEGFLESVLSRRAIKEATLKIWMLVVVSKICYPTKTGGGEMEMLLQAVGSGGRDCQERRCSGATVVVIHLLP